MAGARHAAAQVRALAERLQAPVVPFRGGRGIVGDDHPLGFTCVSGFERWPETDVVVGIGSRLELFAAQELATTVQYGLDVVAAMFDNGYYGNVHLDQERLFEGRALGGWLGTRTSPGSPRRSARSA